MAGSLSDAGENALLDHLLGTATLTSAVRFVSLHTSANTDAAAGTEVSGGAYTRVSATFTATSGGATSNTAAIVFPTATAAWGTITHVGVYSAATAGTYLAWADLTTAKTVGSGDGFEISAGNLSITLT